MSVLASLKPASVFRFFEEMEQIPRVSGHTQKISDYFVAFAKDRGLSFLQDRAGNVLIRKDGTGGHEKSPIVILQGHMDMVGQKAEGSAHDFLQDPLALAVDGDEIYAEGTTLGGDDIIAAAYALAILDDDSIPHPPLEVLITVDEEIGCLGAFAFDTSSLKGRMLINIDSEEEGILTVGCAGGIRAETKLPVAREETEGTSYTVVVSGLLGGHSGAVIQEGRINADKLMGRFLYALAGKMPYRLENLSGGDKDNAIPLQSSAAIVAGDGEEAALQSFAEEFQNRIREEYRDIDDGVCISVTKGIPGNYRVLTSESTKKVLAMLLNLPYGVIRMMKDLPDHVQTSSNLGIMETGEKEFRTVSLPRSSNTGERDAVADRIASLAEALGGSFEGKNPYPAWAYAPKSALRGIMTDVYKTMYGRKPLVDVTHGGLECGIFYHEMEGLDAVSIGPDMKDIHTCKERLSVSSVGRVWEFLLQVLARI